MGRGAVVVLRFSASAVVHGAPLVSMSARPGGGCGCATIVVVAVAVELPSFRVQRHCVCQSSGNEAMASLWSCQGEKSQSSGAYQPSTQVRSCLRRRPHISQVLFNDKTHLEAHMTVLVRQQTIFQGAAPAWQERPTCGS